MKHFFQHFSGIGATLLLTLVLLTGVKSTQAYEPGVKELESRIEVLESQLGNLDITNEVQTVRYAQLQDSIISLKNDIVHLNELAIADLRRQQSKRGNNQEKLGLISFGLLCLVLLSAGLIFVFRKRVVANENAGVFSVLVNDLKGEVSPVPVQSARSRKVNIMVVVSLVIMLSSLLMYLLRVM